MTSSNKRGKTTMLLVTKCTYLLTSPHINTESINPVSGGISQYGKGKRNNKSNSFLALIRIIKRTAKSIILQTSHPSSDSFLPSKGISCTINTGTTCRTRWDKVFWRRSLTLFHVITNKRKVHREDGW